MNDANPHLQGIIERMGADDRHVTLYGVADVDMTREELIGALRFSRMEAERAKECYRRDIKLVGDLGRAAGRTVPLRVGP